MSVIIKLQSNGMFREPTGQSAVNNRNATHNAMVNACCCRQLVTGETLSERPRLDRRPHAHTAVRIQVLISWRLAAWYHGAAGRSGTRCIATCLPIAPYGRIRRCIRYPLSQNKLSAYKRTCAMNGLSLLTASQHKLSTCRRTCAAYELSLLTASCACS